MPDAHKNAAYSLVATAPSPASSGTSLVVTAGEGGRFPAVPFNATIWAAGAQPSFVAGGTTGGNFEIVRVTNIATDTLTITRAQESTTARTVVVGDQIAATVTAKTLTDAETADYAPGGTDVAVADGGTGASTAATARTNLGVANSGAEGGGKWWRPILYSAANGAKVITANTIFARRVRVQAGTIDRLSTSIWAAGGAGEVARMGVYADSAGRPAALVVDGGTVDFSSGSGGALKTLTVSAPVNPGVYWLALAHQGPTNTAQFVTYGEGTTSGQFGGLDNLTEMTGSSNVYDQSLEVAKVAASGSFPDPFGTPTMAKLDVITPMMMFRLT